MKNLNIDFDDEDFKKLKAKKVRTAYCWRDFIIEASRRM